MNTALLLVVVCAALWSLESVIPLYRYPRNRLRRALPNLGLTAIVLLTNLVLSFGVATIANLVAVHRVGFLSIARLPSWLELLLGIAALDFFAYVAHVAMHKSPLGWRVHRLHHTDDEVDVTTAFRQHPIESVWRVFWQLPAIALAGIPLGVVVVYVAVSAVNAQLEHANLRLPALLDRALRTLVVTPNMHKVHHSRRQQETDSNYANIFSLWDRLFGTYTARVDFNALRYGLD